MLTKYTVNRNTFKSYSDEFIVLDNLTIYDKDKKILNITVSGLYNFIVGDKLIFSRELDDGDSFYAEYIIRNIATNKTNKTTTFSIDCNIEEYSIYPSSVSDITMQCYYGTDRDKRCYILTFNTKHICIADRGKIVISDMLNCGDRLTHDFCGDYILYGKHLLYNVSKEPIIHTVNLENIEHYKIFSIGNKEYNTLIPVSYSGYDDRSHMLVFGSKPDINQPFRMYDCRFFDVVLNEKNNFEFKKHKNTKITVKLSSINIDLTLNESFLNNIQHDVLVNDYIDSVKDKYVEEIIDYEKVMFKYVKYHKTENEEYPLVKEGDCLKFNIFLRERHFYKESGDWKPSIINDNGVWIPSEDAFWNSFDGNDYKYNELTYKTGDLLGDLGFDDNDVLNQNKRLGQTFIRLLFFDSKDRATQTLLYYSTIFLNTTELYSKYMGNIISKQKLNNVNQFVFNPNTNPDLQLGCQFTCYNKNNMSGSSEGFYLYLFPSLLDTIKDKKIYMRVEFNHAMYGKTIPLTYFNGRPKTTYNYVLNNNIIGTDLQSLYNDMYIEVNIDRTSDGEYIWYVNNMENDIFYLWEPKVK